MARLTDLPTEILVDVLEDPSFPSNTLYALVLTCRRLHLIALSIYFARHSRAGTPRSMVVRMRADRQDLLATLQMALFVPEIKDFTFIFPHPSCVTIFPLLPHLRRVQRYIARLQSVQKVTLQLDEDRSRCLSVGGPRALRDWTTHLGGLLNCIVTKGCTSLTMRYGNQLTKPSAPNPDAARRGVQIDRLLTFLPAFIRSSPTVQRWGSRVEMTPPSSSRHPYKLQSLTIQSPILIVHPGLNWTLPILKHSQITSLTLGRGTEEASVWTAVLPQIASAVWSLTSLTFLDADFLPSADILEFISHLPLLEYLAILSRRDTESRPLVGPLSPLRHLETLRTSPTFVRHFLRHPACFPQIKSICILWPDYYTPSTVGVLGPVLAETMDTLHTRGLSPSLSISFSSVLVMDRADVSAKYSHGGFSHGGFPSLLQDIIAMEITSFNGTFWASDVPYVTAWIALCPRVQRVDITLAESSNVDGPYIAQALEPTEFLNKVTVDGTDYALVCCC
ncbi:hypothetical protein C8F04DRAFT_1108068 [Mycena alexandri]|uniref:F-box domain-containing protein n=1 Tax=Mycena alexandri TaxID=1745969 RepID=A0AAD6X4S9_9AGAR|nr:hypothetical protein C8F04DRAFT_1108068 [Mycena alexandri]